MIELLPVSIGIGLVVGMSLSELFGLAAGGMIVPGYFALRLTQPLSILLTFAAGFSTYALVRASSSILIIYGRRRTIFMILVGYLSGMLISHFFGGSFISNEEYAVIGFIIPGLIAIWMDRQGVFETICSVLVASAIVRLILTIFLGTELRP